MITAAHLAQAHVDLTQNEWATKARPNQLPPPGAWRTWIVMAGRGFGKTRTGSEWVTAKALSGCYPRIALVGATAADVRDVMIEGRSGLLAVAPKHARPEFQSSKRRVEWPNGCLAFAYSAEEPERLRGPEHFALWADELGAWANAMETWDNAIPGLRLGDNPQALVTTTPRPTPLMKKLMAREGRGVVVTRGKTSDNAANLAPGVIEDLRDLFGNTRRGRQELDGELLLDTPGALWTIEDIERARLPATADPALRRVVVAIDPAVSTKEGSNLTGLVVAGVDADGHFYVLCDRSGILTPDGWGRRAVDLFRDWEADRIIGEANNGGDLIEATVRNVDPNVPFRKVHASRGKAVRAEPVAALYEQGRVHHVGMFPELEDQLVTFTSDFDRNRAGYSPDRLDAMVWAITELMGRGQVFNDVIIEPVSIMNDGGARLDYSTSLGRYEFD